MNFDKWGLQLKLSIPLGFITTIILIIYGIISYNGKKDDLFLRLNNEIKGTANKLKVNLVEPFLLLEDESIEGILKSELYELESIIGIQILDKDGKEVYYSLGKNSNSKIIEKEWDKSIVSKEVIVNETILKDQKNNDELALIRLIWSDATLKTKLNEELINISIVIFLIDFFLFFTIFILLKVLVIHPLKIMADYAKKLDFKNLNETDFILSRKEKGDEIYKLAKTLNNMKNNLHITQKEVLAYADNLEKKVEERTNDLKEILNETNGMLANINKAIFRSNSDGKILSPVSNYSKTIFNQDIIGKHALSLLFFHFKDGSNEKEELIKSFTKIFGGDEKKYLDFKKGLPTKVTIPDKRNKKGKVLDISYIPLFDKRSKIEKLMFIVEDVTKLEQDLEIYRESKNNLRSLEDIIFIKEKKNLIFDLPSLIIYVVEHLDILHQFELESSSIDKYTAKLKDVIHFIKSKKVESIETIKLILDDISWGEVNLRANLDRKFMDIILTSLEDDITNLIIKFILYFDQINYLKDTGIYSGVEFCEDLNLKKKVDDKIDDFERVMVNLLEYIFLVRSVKDLTKENISNAPIKARLYEEFDSTIKLIKRRSKLISFFLRIVGNKKKAQKFWELSELLEQMPSKNKLTEAALINHLIEPYKKTL